MIIQSHLDAQATFWRLDLLALAFADEAVVSSSGALATWVFFLRGTLFFLEGVPLFFFPLPPLPFELGAAGDLFLFLFLPFLSLELPPMPRSLQSCLARPPMIYQWYIGGNWLYNWANGPAYKMMSKPSNGRWNISMDITIKLSNQVWSSKCWPVACFQRNQGGAPKMVAKIKFMNTVNVKPCMMNTSQSENSRTHVVPRYWFLTSSFWSAISFKSLIGKLIDPKQEEWMLHNFLVVYAKQTCKHFLTQNLHGKNHLHSLWWSLERPPHQVDKIGAVQVRLDRLPSITDVPATRSS